MDKDKLYQINMDKDKLYQINMDKDKLYQINMDKNKLLKSTIINNIDIIIDDNLTWKEAKQRFKLDNGNIQKIYIRYITKKYGYMTSLLLLKYND